MAGTIAADWTIKCGLCGAIQKLPDAHGTRFAAMRAANALGWHHRVKRGWVCSVCWRRGENMEIVCDLIDLADMLEAVDAALISPPRARDRLRELREYLCVHCREKAAGQSPPRCNFCKIRQKNT